MRLQNRIKNAFNKAGNSYDTHSSLQKYVGSQLIQLMLTVFHKQKLPRIIDLGCGTGSVTQQLIDNIPMSELHAVDIAEDLLKIARARLKNPNVHIYSRAFDQAQDSDTFFDIAFSNMSLHWSEHFHATIQSLHTQLNKHGIIAFSVPLPGSLAELSPHFAVNDFQTAEDITQTLADIGFDVLALENEKVTLPFADTLSALKSIKNVGANTSKAKSQKPLSGKSLINRIEIRELTYRIGYYIARKTEHPCQTIFSLPAQTLTLAKPMSV